MGAILRSAAAAGVTGVILPRDRSAPLGGTTAKIAAGALAHLAICVVTNLSIFLQKLQQKNIWLYGTVKDGGTSVFITDLTGPVCLVIGNEEKGLRPLVAKQCDFKVTIPMQGSLDSLNASVAAGISLFEVVRQRTKIV
jgi:23S rRNA (guanosine2251-2'-O)-methyltransferase